MAWEEHDQTNQFGTIDFRLYNSFCLLDLSATPFYLSQWLDLVRDCSLNIVMNSLIFKLEEIS